MKRQIKFRGKTVANGHWVCGYYYSECGITYIIEDKQAISGLSRNIACEVIPDTVGQFTGLLDKNGKEIYEGDVLGFSTKRKMGYQKDGVEITVSVVFGRYNPNCDTLSEYMGFWVESGFGNRGSIAYEVDSHGAKVIGNIHDNPELQKGGSDA